MVAYFFCKIGLGPLAVIMSKKFRNPLINRVFNEIHKHVDVIFNKSVPLIEEVAVNLLNSFEERVSHNFSYNRIETSPS